MAISDSGANVSPRSQPVLARPPMTDLLRVSAAPDWRLASKPGVLGISLLGGVSLNFAGQDIRVNGRKARAILAYLALSGSGEEARERLAGLLWSESNEEKARATLRQVIHGLREALLLYQCDALCPTRLTVALDRDMLRVDTAELLSAVQAGEVPEVLLRQQRLPDALLAGFEDLDPAFHVWLLARRQALHDQLMRALEDGYRNAARPRHDRRRLAAAAQRLDPTHEEACRVFMQCAAQEGDTAAALRAYNDLWTLLEQDYDCEPSNATQELVADIKLGKYDSAASGMAEEVQQLLVAERPAAPARPHQAPPPRTAVQVAAVGATGVSQDRMHLVTGFRHELIACLVRFREWSVVDSSGPVSAAVPGLARYLVEANAYQAGAAIHVVLTLRDCEAAKFVWSERFELRLDSWFESQQRIVRRIAGTMNGQVSTERLMRLAAEPDVSPDVYDCWLRGQEMIRFFGADQWNEAARLFAETIERAPNFSPPYSSLVQMNNAMHIVHPGVWRDAGKAARTLNLARRAVDLDPLDSRAQLCLGWSLAMSRHYAQAAVHMQLACELNPNDPWTLISAALFHAFNGEFAVACDLMQQSFESTLSPTRTHWGYAVSVAYLTGDYAGALAACDRCEDVIINLTAWRAAALHRLGRQDEAESQAQRFLAIARAGWTGEPAPTDEAIGRWLLHLYPISRADVWEYLRDGVSGAGIPTAGIAHHQW